MKKIVIALMAVLFAVSLQGKEMKMNKALIVYGSFMGSTAEAAEFMKKELEKEKWQVDISPAAKAAGDLKKYDLVILGSAIHGAAPHPDILTYVSANTKSLNETRTAVFILCATITSSNKKTREKAQLYPEKVAIGFTPVSTAVFGGVLGEPKSGFERFMAKMMLGLDKFGDFRDWDSIRKWTLSLAGSMR